jgi:WD40 repeat protein
LQRITVENAQQVRLLATLALPDYVFDFPYTQCNADFSPDGNLLAGACGYDQLIVWEIPGLKLRHQILDERIPISCSFSSDGHRLACGNWDNSIVIWDLESGEEMLQVGEHRSPVWETDFSPDGQRLASCGAIGANDNEIGLWQIAPNARLWVRDTVHYDCLSISYHPTGETLVYGGLSGFVEVVDVETAESIEVLYDARKNVGDIIFSPSGDWIVAGCDDHKIYVWDASDYQLVNTLVGHKHYVNGVDFNADETLLVSGSGQHDRTLGLWSFQDGRLLKQLDGHKNSVLRVDMNPDDTLIASISWDGTVRLWGIPAPVVPPTATPIPTATSTPTPIEPALSIRVPRGAAPNVNGKLSEGEWDGASVAPLSNGGQLYLLYADGYLFLGIRGGEEDGIGSVCRYEDGEVSILHASAGYTTAHYSPGDEYWRLHKMEIGTYYMQLSESRWQEQHLKDYGWTASVFDDGNPGEIEYQIAMQGEEVILAVAYVFGMGDATFLHYEMWPENTDDDCGRMELTAQTPNVSKLQFSPENWVKVIVVENE